MVGHHPAKIGGYKFFGSRNAFNLSRDLARPNHSRVMRLYKEKPLKVGQQPGQFGGHRHYGSGDTILVCHMASQDHVIKGSCNFMSTSPSK